MANIEVENTGGGTVSGVTDAQLASPNNSVYREIFTTGGHGTASAVAGTKYFVVAGSPEISAIGPGTGAQYMRNLAAADYTVASKTLMLRLDCIVNVATALSQTITFGLYPVVAGATLTLGTVIASSTVAFVNPGTNSLTAQNSGDFAFPADGIYAVGMVVSGTPSANFAYQSLLEQRSV